MRELLRKALALVQSKRAYVVHLEPRLMGRFDADAAFLAANLDLFKPLIPPAGPPRRTRARSWWWGPNPDDEAVGAGGSLILARQRGVAPTLAFLTDAPPGRQPRGG